MQELLAHLIGDYVVQSDWMATQKTARSIAAFAHATAYTSVFLLLFGTRWEALVVIGGTHFVIDRFRLARYVIRAKNLLLAPPGAAPRNVNPATGYPAETPPWMAVWLLIIVDNTMHLTINHVALALLTRLPSVPGLFDRLHRLG